MKQAILIRKDLRMRRGKEIVQGSHAALGAAMQASPGFLALWANDGFMKVCLQVATETELIDAYKRADKAGLVTYLVRDAGLTEFNGEQPITALAIGPGHDSPINNITADFELY